jgi:tRNA (guanine37-N1)-methyltransferase
VLRFRIVTIFPDYFRTIFDYGVVRRAKSRGLIEIEAHDLRLWATGKHRTVDDRPFGGGDGMVLKPEPIFAAVEELTGAGERERLPEGVRVVLLSPQGRTLTQALAEELSRSSEIIIICGRYEGVDERVSESLTTDEISIGDYVLSGGEPAAVVLIDAIARLVPGVLGNETSAANESFSGGVLDFPHYTRPPDFRGQHVPEVLLGGHHAEVAQWRRIAALRKTQRNRPDLFTNAELTEAERRQLKGEGDAD